MRRTPALIVGGGPAGAIAALLLARAGAPHLLIERQAQTGDVLCGGFLSWRTLAVLARLGIEGDALGARSVTQVALFAGTRRAIVALPHAAAAVSRHRLDTLLLDHAARAGARIERGIGARATIDGGIRLDDGSEITADALFLATGKHDLRGAARPVPARDTDRVLGLRTRLGPAPALDRLIGDRIELHLFDRGYAGIVLLEDGTANCCLAVHRSRLGAGSPAALLDRLAIENPALGERLAWRGAAPIDAVANIPYGWRATRGLPGLFRLGDQAAVIPSLAGEGIGIAIAGAAAATQAYLRDGHDASGAWQPGFARHIAGAMRVAGGVRRLAESPVTAPPLVIAAATCPWLVRLVARLTRVGSIPM
ncbi:NAD(P)/FAD-dependent oxidoreductase [Hephaestia sp. GCM10023244]|uniref:FAD-dependent monooxygenase n=1 Tax=unclassified Hephaestia TaxID=2631281 RepID=UPI002077460C|nr:FAD-dependent monooxygenase [Hephaestia sp. MAHUQ-44]MCM8731173.1 FAD-dependent monooxygenase [Hephaestia sp. MAHUQ-44]